ncbi:hypothetical protein Tco_0386331 [Tanacetum coccineum]
MPVTTRSGKTLEEPSTPLVPTPDVSIPQKEPEQNPETSTEKVQNPNLENTAIKFAIIMYKVPEKLDVQANFLSHVVLCKNSIGLVFAIQELALTCYLILYTKKLGLEALTPTSNGHSCLPIVHYSLNGHSRGVEEIKAKEDEVSRDIPTHTIVMPIRITFDNPIDFNDHFSKPKDFQKDLTVLFDSSKSSILPFPLLDSDSPFTAELSASFTLNSSFPPETEDSIQTRVLFLQDLVVLMKPSFLLPSPEPPDDFLNFKPNLVLKNVMLNEDFYQSKKTLPLKCGDGQFLHLEFFLPLISIYPEASPLIFSL